MRKAELNYLKHEIKLIENECDGALHGLTYEKISVEELLEFVRTVEFSLNVIKDSLDKLEVS